VCADSDDILDHIDWVQGGHALKALDKEMEERVSMWRRKVNEMLPIGKKAVLGGSKAKLMQLLKELDSEVVGPYLCGKQVTVADCATFPFFWRLDNEYDLGDVCPNLLDWLRYCQDENPAFTKTVQTAWWWWW
jgi:glutathione S-transferase